MLLRHKYSFPVLFFAITLLLFNFSFLCAHFIMLDTSEENTSVFFLSLINVLWIATTCYFKNFDLRIICNLIRHLKKIAEALAFHILLIPVILLFFKLQRVSQVQLSVSYILFFVLLIIFRYILQVSLNVLSKTNLHKNILIIANENWSVRLIKHIADRGGDEYYLRDCITETEVCQLPFDQLLQKIIGYEPAVLFLCIKDCNSEFLAQIKEISRTNRIQLKIVSHLPLRELTAVESVAVNDISLLNIPHEIVSGQTKFAKRAFDVTFSSIVILFGSPVFLILTLLTKATSKGPIFYKQERVGENGKLFFIYKFRSMRTDAELSGPQLSRDNDPRITKLGKHLRKTRLDEIPQFWNVLKGDMSVVGPRPERQYYTNQIRALMPDYEHLIKLRPGITSIGQVHYGYAENIQQMCDRAIHDLTYLENINLNYDMRIILRTVVVMAYGKGK